MSDTLKPCPFCRSSDLSIDTNEGAPWERSDGSGWYRVWCRHCFATGPETEWKDEAANAWNARDDTPADPADAVAQMVQRKVAAFLDDSRKLLPPESMANHDRLFHAVAQFVNARETGTKQEAKVARDFLIDTFKQITRG